MIRSILGILALIVATLWFPWWLQVPLYIACLVLIPHRLLLYIPAIIADAKYAPTTEFAFSNFKTIAFVSALLLIHWIIMTKTRISQLYVQEKIK